MISNDLWKNFDNGSLRLPGATAEFTDIPWAKHPAFDGVELKHIVTAKDTDSQFSYHLVRIAPGKSIASHIHETQLETHEVIAGSGVCVNNGTPISYTPGIVSIMPAGIPHEVDAGTDGLLLFAKFMPALC